MTAPALHGYFRSSASYRVRIALNIKGVDYVQHAHHLRRGEQRAPDYLTLNPQGLVPTYVDNDHILTQSLAIIEYLDEIYPQPPLLPEASWERARVRALAQIIACDIHPLNNLRVLQYLRDDFRQDEPSVRRWYAHWIEQGFSAFEQMLADSATGRFCHGDQPTLADVCLAPQVANARNFNVSIDAFPTIRRIIEVAEALPAFARAAPQLQPDAE